MKGVFVIALIAACSGPGGMAVDAAAPIDQGVGVAWHSDVPGALDATHRVDTTSLQVRHLRVIGDAGESDHDAILAIAWAAGQMPTVTPLTAAAPGMYSKLSFELDGEITGYSYQITGTTIVGGESRAFVIRDRAEVHYTETLDAALAPAGSVEIPLVLDLHAAITAIDFSALPDEAGVLVLETGDAQIGKFRSNLAAAFTVAH